jgi:hypothetical protein
MGQKLAHSASFAGGWLGAFVLLAAAVPRPAHAQHADAGVEHTAATPPPPPVQPAAGVHAGSSDEPSGVLPKLINPSQLSEGTRARLAERAAGRHPTSFPAREPMPHHQLPHEEGATSMPAYRPRLDTAEPLRRGQARMRVQAVETDDGVTLLSNRIQLPEPRISAAIAKRPLPVPEPPVAEDPVAAADTPNVTETHSLRPSTSHNASHDAKAKNKSTGLGWLLWPFALFVTTGAVVGTLWFRKKTE